MAFVIMDTCRDEKAGECVSICPVDCIEEGADQFYIDPNTCIDCGACVAACPVSAIVDENDLPAEQEEQLEKAESFFV
ncbi:NAD-dependent dihydropyrimidine dehydrogenase PreA subunit [Geomicrobium halophilum]|uniref:Ferredoxin n=1 Tax=Geomicrobium halophilum TaxID=549000 RepID=A0A841PVC8_9BACL|nr:4Fe-4S binding protein [Geomicrobium halophilum]MBB6451106.1 NAD-dependent dihydropyrimidine dehydrogenase PreA subunit [Geomicrobium halophilum]